MERRHFLKMLPAAGITTALAARVSSEGGIVNALENPSEADIAKIHEQIANDPFMRPSHASYPFPIRSTSYNAMTTTMTTGQRSLCRGRDETE